MEEQQEALPQGLETNKDDMQKELLLLPKLIYQMRKTLIGQEKKVSEKISERKKIDYEIAKAVTNETTKEEEGKEKLVYRNAMSRDAEVKRRLNDNEKYQKLKEEEQKAKELVDETRYDIEYCFNRLKSLQKIAPFYYGSNI